MLGPWRHEIKALLEIGIGSLTGWAPANMRYWWYAMKRHNHVPKAAPGTMPGDQSYRPGASLRAWRRYLRRMAKARTWGDEITLRAIADAYDVKIHLVTSAREHWLLRYGGDDAAARDARGAGDAGGATGDDAPPAARRRELFLSYISPIHYNAVVPRAEDEDGPGAATEDEPAAAATVPQGA